MGEEKLIRFSPAAAFAVVLAFAGGFSMHALYTRWTESAWEAPTTAEPLAREGQAEAGTPQSHPLSYAPLAPAPAPEPPLLDVREVAQLRALSGRQARVRGTIFRVGHSDKSNTYFLNFGPSREALTAVVFASAAELFDKKKMPLKSLESKEVEVTGEIKDHPQYGLEIIIENPVQLNIVR
jgi:hypothetical protein